MINLRRAQEPTFFIPGPAGKLEAIATPPVQPGRKVCAIICHPHPLYGGTMHNKVVTTVQRAFQNLGLDVVRFHFRGVGESEGSYDNAVGELQDLLAVVAWVRENYSGYAIWLAGFSFGACIAARGAVDVQPQQLVMVAPAVGNFPLDLPMMAYPCLVVQGEKDEIVSPQAVYDWVASQQPRPRLIKLAEATHFFHGRLQVLRETVEGELG